VRLSTLAGLGILLAACQTHPEVRSQASAQFDLARYHTYGFVEKPSTDTGGYKSLTTQSLERAVAREMLDRGYTPAPPGQQPDLLINFNVRERDKVESEPGPAVAVGYGWGWHSYGVGWGMGDYYNDVRTVTEGSIIVDLVDRQRNEAVWSGTAVGQLTKQALDHPDARIDRAVHDIFKRYPKKSMSES
jgi:hypothetical protein